MDRATEPTTEQGVAGARRLAPHFASLGEALAALWAAAALPALEMAALRLVQVLDLFWVGRLGPDALAAVAAGVSLRWVASSLAAGVGVGGMAAVARHRGERGSGAASEAGWQTVLVSTAVAAVMGAAGWMLAPSALRLLGLGRSAPALTYLRISLLGLVPIAALPALAALLRAAGGAGAARLALVAAAALTALLDPLLVLGWGPLPGLGVAGAALAAAAGPAVAAAALFAALARGYGCLSLRARMLRLRPRAVARLLSDGAPASLQLELRALARVALLGVILRFGTGALAGFAAADALLALVFIPSYALADGAAALAARSLRQSLPEQAARRVVCAAGVLNLGYAGAVVLAVFALAPQAIAFLSPLPHVIAHGADALRLGSLGYAAGSLGVVVARGLDRTGQTVPTAAVNALTLWGIQVPAAVLLSRLLGPSGVWLALAAGAAANGLLLGYRFRHGRAPYT